MGTQGQFDFGCDRKSAVERPATRLSRKEVIIPQEHDSPNTCIDAIQKIVEDSHPSVRVLLNATYSPLCPNSCQESYTISLDAKMYHHHSGEDFHYFQHQTCPNTGTRTHERGDGRLDPDTEAKDYLERVIGELQDRGLFTAEGSVFARHEEAERISQGNLEDYLVPLVN
ncbi:hypothetical protein HN604_01845 [archaeon]|jgi:hypothetical protein|nr:hypothetical protein [archaeon]MBT6182945.1 hypothetical protein [archaeon]MBT6606590.1 hypothetical protein [archaeon]MBT7251783.1 hypothetical protein [archaeon]MBT7660804.1 hypothetical protein [archaeon]